MMNKKDGLRTGIAEMRSVAQRLNQWADDLEASFRDKETDASEVPASVPGSAEKKKTAGGSRLQEGVPPSASSEGGAQRIQVIAKR